MKTVSLWLFALLFPLLTAGSVLAKDYTEGKEYLVLATPQATVNSDKIEVVELFWYGCPHCYRLEPALTKWLETKPEDVDFIRLPAMLGKNWELLARAWFTAELLGVTDTVHLAIFETIHKDRKKIRDEEALQAVFTAQGVKEEDFSNTFHSFAVAVKINNARMMTKRYSITGVPTIIINGKYSTAPSKAGSNQGAVNVMDYLIDQERMRSAAVATP